MVFQESPDSLELREPPEKQEQLEPTDLQDRVDRTAYAETSANQDQRENVVPGEEPERRETRDGEECKDHEDQQDPQADRERLESMG